MGLYAHTGTEQLGHVTRTDQPVSPARKQGHKAEMRIRGDASVSSRLNFFIYRGGGGTRGLISLTGVPKTSIRVPK